MPDDPFEVVDSKINNLRRAYEDGGKKALSKAMAELAKNDAVSFVTVAGAFFPEMIREALKDAMAAAGITEDDLREFVRKSESPSASNH